GGSARAQMVEPGGAHEAAPLLQQRVPVDVVEQRPPGVTDDVDALRPGCRDLGDVPVEPGSPLLVGASGARLGHEERPAVALVVTDSGGCQPDGPGRLDDVRRAPGVDVEV